ncbi:MAG TPA: 4Fe-4S binding protein [Firmicutes bacterium]|jgi:ferredoxin-type protein NapH|nr:4Fe-4S binding protein [Bacillota bacterium]
MRRRLTQFTTAILANSYFPGFLQARIYRGPLKAVCVPFLNCYSCPGAWGSCPVGSFQSLAAGFSQTVSLYVLGVLTAVGALGGRVVCGWLCPFGLFQDILYGLKTRKWQLPRAAEYVKFIVLGLTVTLPFVWRSAVGIAEPYFCKYICPAGTLEAGLPLVFLRPELRELMGPVFLVKLAILAALILAGIVIWRPFCRVLCPLGAFYGLFNHLSLWRLQVDQSLCTGCHACSRRCSVGLVPHKDPNSSACVRCLECAKACPTGALTFSRALSGLQVPGVNIRC